MQKGTELTHWSSEEEKYLKSNAGKKSSKDIAKHINRTKEAVEQRACRMGISLAVGGRQWVPLMMSEIKQAAEMLRENSNKSQCALKMGVTYSRFSLMIKRAKKMGIYIEKANVK